MKLFSTLLNISVPNNNIKVMITKLKTNIAGLKLPAPKYPYLKHSKIPVRGLKFMKCFNFGDNNEVG